MAKKLHVDIETFSSVDIRACGAYKYIESEDFEIILLAYAIDDNPIKDISLVLGEKLPAEFIEAMNDKNVEKHAHNAVFERLSFARIGMKRPISEWFCSAIKASYCGLPLSLGDVSSAMKLKEKGKLATGKALIKFFCCPTKPKKKKDTKQASLFGEEPVINRNLPQNHPDKWSEFVKYCINDVEAEREIINRLGKYKINEWERKNYILDQEINDRGILVDLKLARHAYDIDSKFSEELSVEMERITSLANPNSPTQLKQWLGAHLHRDITSLGKALIPDLIEEAGPGVVSDLLKLRLMSAKSSVKKYTRMLECACRDKRAHGLFQFYGARTGRWAGRLVQLQNLPQNHLEDLEEDRSAVATGDYELVTMMYDDVPSLLSQLIRTAFIAPKGMTFAVADFSAIEARVIAWLAGEKWRMDVFRTTGKIYEASAAMMFNVDISEVTKGSDMRAKGKIAELALGYQGGLGALKTMGGEKMGLSDHEMEDIVKRWRKKSPSIVALWYAVEKAAKRALRTHKPVVIKQGGLIFDFNGEVLTIELPSGRVISYWHAGFTTNRFGNESIRYRGSDSTTKQWTWLETYGGKMTENIIQAIARDLLMYSMRRLNEEGFPITMHVHDEAIAEVPLKGAEKSLERMCEIMGEDSPFCKGLPLVADGYITPFYKKD